MTFWSWLRMLYLQKGRIHPAFWFRSLMLMITSLGNLPLQLVEITRMPRIRKQKVKQPVFILGHPRSGTTHLHYLMSKDPQFAFCSVFDAIVPHIFLSGGKVFSKLLALSMPSTRPQDEVSLSIDSPKEEEFAMATMCGISYMNCFYFPSTAKENFKQSVLYEKKGQAQYWQKHFAYFLQKLSFKYGNKRLLLKSPANTGRVKEILELYPDACFVHISRHPYEVYLSTVRLFEKIVPLTSFQKPSSEELEAFIVWSYREMYRKYAEAKVGLRPEQLVEVRFADLETDPNTVLKTMYSQLNIPLSEQALQGFEEELKRTEHYAKNNYDQIPDALKLRLQKEWSEAFQLFGYSA